MDTRPDTQCGRRACISSTACPVALASIYPRFIAPDVKPAHVYPTTVRKLGCGCRLLLSTHKHTHTHTPTVLEQYQSWGIGFAYLKPHYCRTRRLPPCCPSRVVEHTTTFPASPFGDLPFAPQVGEWWTFHFVVHPAVLDQKTWL
jgi:hypothetical protein